MGVSANALVMWRAVTSMNWTQSHDHPLGFHGAKAVLIAERYLLAKWDNDRCRGWQLYIRRERSVVKLTWLAGAGTESLDWTDEQVMQFAERVVRGLTSRPAAGTD